MKLETMTKKELIAAVKKSDKEKLDIARKFARANGTVKQLEADLRRARNLDGLHVWRTECSAGNVCAADNQGLSDGMSVDFYLRAEELVGVEVCVGSKVVSRTGWFPADAFEEA